MKRTREKVVSPFASSLIQHSGKTQLKACKNEEVLIPIVRWNDHSCFIEEEWTMLFFAGHSTKKVNFFIIMLVLYHCMWMLVSSDMNIGLIHFVTYMVWAHRKKLVFPWNRLLPFSLHFFTKLIPLHFAWCCEHMKQLQLVRFKAPFLCNTLPLTDRDLHTLYKRIQFLQTASIMCLCYLCVVFFF